jgi:hypothetical protein
MELYGQGQLPGYDEIDSAIISFLIAVSDRCFPSLANEVECIEKVVMNANVAIQINLMGFMVFSLKKF